MKENKEEEISAAEKWWYESKWWGEEYCKFIENRGSLFRCYRSLALGGRDKESLIKKLIKRVKMGIKL